MEKEFSILLVIVITCVFFSVNGAFYDNQQKTIIENNTKTTFKISLTGITTGTASCITPALVPAISAIPGNSKVNTSIAMDIEQWSDSRSCQGNYWLKLCSATDHRQCAMISALGIAGKHKSEGGVINYTIHPFKRKNYCLQMDVGGKQMKGFLTYPYKRHHDFLATITINHCNMANFYLWSDEYPVAGNGQGLSPRVVVVNGKAFYAYYTQSDPHKLMYRIGTPSADGDAYQWSEPHQLAGNGLGLSPAVAVVNGKVFYTYYSGGFPHKLFYRIGTPSTDGNHYQWSAEYKLAGDAQGLSPAVALVNGKIFYTYISGKDPHKLYYRIGTPSSDGNEPYTWSNDYKIVANAQGLNPVVVVVNGKVFYTYYSGGSPHKLYYRIGTSIDNGTQYQWSEQYQVAGNGVGLAPTVAVVNDKLFYTYFSEGNPHKLLYRIGTPSTDGDSYQWSEQYQVAGNGVGLNPTAVMFKGKLFYAYMTGKNPNQLYYQIGTPSTDGTQYQWSEPYQVSGNGLGLNPTVAVLNGKLLYTYYSGGQTHKLFYRIGTPSGNGNYRYQWSDEQWVAGSGLGLYPTMAAVNNKLFYTYVSGVSSGDLDQSKLFYRVGTPSSDGKRYQWSVQHLAVGNR